MHRHNRFPIFFAPDTAETISAGTIDIPVVPAHQGPVVTEVNLGEPSAGDSAAVRALEPKAKGNANSRSPADLGMESTEDSAARAGLMKDRVRDPASGKFVKSDGTTVEPPKKPVAAKPTTTPAKPPVTTQKPVATPAKPAPTLATKFKIGDQEKTPEEWAAHFADLEKKANAPALPKEPEPTPVAELTPEQQAAAQKERETNFITSAAKNYTMSPEDLDVILVGGPQAVQKVAELHAKSEMRSRQFTADTVQKMWDQIEERFGTLGPVMESHQRVSQLMEDTQFLNSNADIKDHPKGLETFHKVRDEMRNTAAAIEKKVEAKTATGREHGWLLQYRDTPKEELDSTIAQYTRDELSKLAPVTPAPSSPPQLKVVQAPINERPLSSDRPGSIGSPRSETPEQRLVREVNSSKGY